MAAGSFVAKPAFAAPSTSGTSSAPVASCNGDKNVDIFNFNDFHGRIATGANLFTPVVEARNANGADKVLLLDAGDNVPLVSTPMPSATTSSTRAGRT